MEAIRSGSVWAIILKDLAAVLVLALASAGIGLGVNALRSKPLPLVYQSREARLEGTVARLSPGTMAPPLADKRNSLPEEIDLVELRRYLTEKGGLLLDARPAVYYRLGHVPGARNLPREDFEKVYGSMKPELERNRAQPIVVYCSSTSCEDSELVRNALWKLGYSNVALFPGGWVEWLKNQLPVEKGDPVP